MSTLTKTATVLTAISFVILLISNILYCNFFQTETCNRILLGMFAFSLLLAIFSFAKNKNAFSVVLIFLTGITLTSLFFENYDVNKIFFSKENEQFSDSLAINNFNSQNAASQLFTEYTKATGNTAIAVLEKTDNLTVFLLSVQGKTAGKVGFREFDYTISQFATAELEARKTFSAIVIFDNNDNFSAQQCLRSVAFFSKGEKTGEEHFAENWQHIDNHNIIRQLQTIVQIMD
ncbi:hypothetical protein FACS189429_8480 [Bacteroidia bacterium]|nr:hypothetical protein FACS189429_8480 [Bacteroidia bacterium]